MPESTLRFARAYAANQLPWFAPALFRCRIHLSEKVPVAAIDPHFNIYFNPKAVQTIVETGSQKEVLAELGFLWIHEICHVLREHSDRAKERNAKPFQWNVAADLEINDSQWKGLQMPKAFPGIFPSTFQLRNGQLVEWYYQKLFKESEEKSKSIQNFSLPNGTKLCDGLDEGSGVHGEARPWEMEAKDAQQLDPLNVEVCLLYTSPSPRDS